jgi:hypothetical protein
MMELGFAEYPLFSRSSACSVTLNIPALRAKIPLAILGGIWFKIVETD